VFRKDEPRCVQERALEALHRANVARRRVDGTPP
jgi:hypothetical protein